MLEEETDEGKGIPNTELVAWRLGRLEKAIEQATQLQTQVAINTETIANLIKSRDRVVTSIWGLTLIVISTILSNFFGVEVKP